MADIAHRRPRDESTRAVTAIEELRRRQQAIPREVAALDAADRRDRAEIDSLGRGFGSVRNRRRIRALHDWVDDRGRQRTSLVAEQAGLELRMAAAERAHTAVVDRDPDPAAAHLDDLDRRLDADRTDRLVSVTPDERLGLERRLGPRPTDVGLADAWNQVAGATLQHRAIEQLGGQVPPQAALLASQLAQVRLDQASRHLDNQRLLRRLNSLQRPNVERELGIDGPGLSL